MAYLRTDDNQIADKSDTFRGTDITIGSVLTGGDTMECSACHDVHNSSLAERNNGERFLWTSNNGSEFCLTCHLKAGDPADGSANQTPNGIGQ